MKFQRQKPEQFQTRYIIILLLITAGLRLIFFGFYQPWNPKIEEQKVLYGDALEYHNLAIALMEQKQFGADENSNSSAIRTPLYPLFAAGIYTIFGKRPWVVLLFQVLLDTISCLLLYAALNYLFSFRVAIFSAFLYGVNPYQIQHCSVLATEVLFMFFLLLSFFFFARALAAEAGKIKLFHSGRTGLFLGLATLVKPISLYLPLCFVFFLFIVYRNQLKQAVKYAFSFVLLFLLLVLPWFSRNYITYGYFSLSTSASYNLLILNAAPMEAVQRNKRLDIVKKELMEECNQAITAEDKNPLELNPFEKAVYWRKVALKYIKNHPFQFLKTYARGVVSIFISLGTSSFAEMLDSAKIPGDKDSGDTHINRLGKLKGLLEGKSAGLLVTALILVLYLGFVYFGAVMGIIRGWRKYRWENLVLILFIVVYFVLVTGAAGTVAARFKIPVLPFLFPLTAMIIATKDTKDTKKIQS